jgi:hypothetical protein
LHRIGIDFAAWTFLNHPKYSSKPSSVFRSLCSEVGYLAKLSRGAKFTLSIVVKFNPVIASFA